ncbi:preprotein translocase subunit YajC [Kitasatospora phosalacinea]|uniref:Preprotein translocase subunit YajC n=1 Tax=Kitasatospora phosalacinea TaxID=2065 RepID=A0A9W6PLD3_9ACTN|nr:preprotein translocase subunit YajC [Kitasatospora phosalacinea]GLW57115.1 preprotein translocase subunit YajC [Kitasatospora phosalacinea]
MFSYIILLLPLLAIFMMMRSQKKRQAQMQNMQTALQPGSGVRTIGGMYALVKAVNDETVELEVAPGVVAHYTKGAIAAVLEPLEYDAIINGRPAEDEAVEDAAADADADEKPLSLSKDEAKVDAEAPESK